MLIKRIISSTILISVIVATMFIDWLCGLLVTLFIIIGLYEFFTMLEKKGMFPGLPFPILFGLATGFLATLIS